MWWSPAEGNVSCMECLEIAREFAEAYAEAREKDPAAADAVRELIGGTEQDAERADGLLSVYRYQPQLGKKPSPTRVQEAMLRSGNHFARSGHWACFAALNGYR